jgi:nicotinate-nucleotide pyrophosphorylase (carboxylating)
MRLSGIATLTRKYVEQIADFIRKASRYAQNYARFKSAGKVRHSVGGAINHRMGWMMQ